MEEKQHRKPQKFQENHYACIQQAFCNIPAELFVDGIQLTTKLKGALMSLSDKLLLGKRAIIETVNDELKNITQVEHSRHRTFDNFIVNILGAITESHKQIDFIYSCVSVIYPPQVHTYAKKT